MDDLCVFIYKLRTFAQAGFFNIPYFACSGEPAYQEETQKNLDFWIARKFAEPTSSVIMPLYMETKDYKRTVGDSTFCTLGVVSSVLALNGQAASFQEKIFAPTEYMKILKIAPPMNTTTCSHHKFFAGA